jgi:hypothetical protein
MNDTCTCTPISRRLTRQCEPCALAELQQALDGFAAAAEAAARALASRT